jgi:hypothetical protein
VLAVPALVIAAVVACAGAVVAAIGWLGFHTLAWIF